MHTHVHVSIQQTHIVLQHAVQTSIFSAWMILTNKVDRGQWYLHVSNEWLSSSDRTVNTRSTITPVRGEGREERGGERRKRRAGKRGEREEGEGGKRGREEEGKK